MKQGEFTLGNLQSSSLNAKLMNYPIATLPERKITQNTSPIGIDRAILFDDGSYNNRQIDLTVGFEGANADENVSKFLAKLDTGKYEDFRMFSDENYTYQVTRSGASTKTRPDYSASYRELTVSLNAAPYKYVYPAKPIEVKENVETTIKNPTSYESKPLIHITVNGDTDLTVNGKVTHIKEVKTDIYLDSAIQDAYIEEGYTMTNANSKLSVGPYPIFKAGNNKVKLSAGTATVEGRWRSI